MRLDYEEDDEVEVAMSPLIDCVFLLLIFFLVTTMMKKLEKQIPVSLPDPTSALAQQPEVQEVVIGVDAEGSFLSQAGREREGDIQYARIDDLAAFLKQIAEERGTETPIRLDADRDTPFQKVIDGLDICQLQQFENVGVRMMIREQEYFQMPGMRNVRPDLPD